MSEPSTKELLEEKAIQGLEDPYYFETEILEVGKHSRPKAEQEIRPSLEWFDRPWPSHLDPLEDKWLMYWSEPRFTGKTIKVASTLTKWIVEDPNIAILYTGAEKQKAAQIVGMVRDWLETPTLERLYGTFKRQGKWGSEHFTVSQRTVKDKRDPTMAADGLDVPMTGLHPDVIVFDDLVGETNATLEGFIKAEYRVSAALPVLRPGGRAIYLCTRWGTSDPSSHILEKWKLDLMWDAPRPRGFFGAYAVKGDEEFFPHAVEGEPLFPSTWSERQIVEARRNWPLELFASQVLNDPMPEEGAYFSSKDFQHFPLYVEDGASP